MTEISPNWEKMSKTLAAMLDYLGLDAQVKIEEIDGKTVLSAVSEDAGRIIGKKGQTLQSLELLVNRISAKNDENASWISINVDGYTTSKGSRKKSSKGFSGKKEKFSSFKKGFSDRGGKFGRGRGHREEDSGFESRGGRGRDETFSDEEKLKQQALDAAKEVKRWGESVTLPPMNSHDRRVIHMTLKEDTEIKTESNSVDGNDRLKTVKICLNDGKSSSPQEE